MSTGALSGAWSGSFGSCAPADGARASTESNVATERRRSAAIFIDIDSEALDPTSNLHRRLAQLARHRHHVAAVLGDARHQLNAALLVLGGERRARAARLLLPRRVQRLGELLELDPLSAEHARRE